MSDISQGYGWWQATDGKWYPPEAHPEYRPTAPRLPTLANPVPTLPAQRFTQVMPASATPPAGHKKPLWRRWWFVATAALVVLIVIGAILAPPKDEATTQSVQPAAIDSISPDAASSTPAETLPPDASVAPTAVSVAPATMPATVPATIPPTAPPAPESNLSPAQQNAVRSAESYLDFMGFSRQGLIDQLSSEYGDQFAVGDATVAVDSLIVDWNAQAVKSAQNYLDVMSFSCQGLIDQLSSEYGDKYTVDQASYGASQTGIC